VTEHEDAETETWQEKSDEELTEMVQQYIDERLTTQTGRVIRMRFDDEKSYKDISHTLGISLSAVNKHIVQGLRKLRQQFNK
jgi:RNA polymerase sigma-70 factor (ECF subfamily)